MDPVSLHCDVLAIRCIGKFIFAAIGNQLHIFDEFSRKCLKILDTFHEDNIHEIVRSDGGLILFGGKNLSVFRFRIRNDEIITDKISSHYFNDWIIAASFIPSLADEKICILFAHNNICIYDTLTKNIENTWCEEKCILYAGCISVNDSDEVVIFSGTVFQEILIWHINAKDKNIGDVPVLHRLRGHKGVIFSIFYDPSLKLITSTSDDRSVRVWEINDEVIVPSPNINWSKVEIHAKTTIFGHTARVWKSVIVNDSIISIGEDSLICIWTLHGELCSKILAHNGATIWSVAISEDKSTIFTGGADGALNSWPLNYNQLTDLDPTLTFNENRTPKFVFYLDSGILVVFFDGGELLCYNSHCQLPTQSIRLPRYQSYCIMKVSPDRTRLALASSDGHVDILERSNNDTELQFNEAAEKVMDSKIFSLQWLNNDMILICGAEGCLLVMEIDQDRLFNVKSEFTLPPSRERWTTAAIIISDLLVCGDRGGNIYIFSMQSGHKKVPAQVFSKIHGRLGVQSLGIFGERMTSTGRDGSLRFYEISKDKEKTCLQPLHWKKMPMEWVSRTVKTPDDFYILGFKEIEFMIYSTRLNRLILRIVCGGGHRSWDCVFMNNIVNFACIRNKQIQTLNNISCTISDSWIAGYHTKEIHTIERLVTAKNHNLFVSGSEDCTFRITSIEKSSNDDKYHIKPLETYDGHISNVKSIAIMNLENSEERTRNIVFTGGGRAQLKVWEITVETQGDVLSQDDLTVIEKTAFMLRGTDKIRRKTWLDNKQPFFMDPETRFMNICANFHPSDNNFIILFVACSDGFIRILLYDIIHDDLKLCTGIPYYHRCVIKIHTFKHQNELILMSMATDGVVNFWLMNSTIEKILIDQNQSCSIDESSLVPIEKWRVHQSGINSYDFRQNKRNEYCLATGGDDNKINLSIFTITVSKSKKMIIDNLAAWDTVNIHAAQITGIKFVDNDKLLSAAIDQRIVMFQYSYDNSVLRVLPIRTIMTFVSDIQGITLFKNQDENEILSCIYGKGLGVISINAKSIIQEK